MKIRILAGLLVLVLVTSCTGPSQGPIKSGYDELVDAAGNISLPDNFQRNWTFLGTWAIDSTEAQQNGVAGFHNVYTQPGVVDYFQDNDRFPDGAVLIKELLSTTTASMTTGTVSRAAGIDGWFVMVKDTEQRFSGNPLWGDGWGWALFNADQPTSTVTQDYKADCLGCHIPARDDDWVYLSGYPMLIDQGQPSE